MSQCIGVWPFFDVSFPSKEVLCTSTMVRSLLARVRCCWSVTHIKTLVWNTLSSWGCQHFLDTACQAREHKGNREQQHPGTETLPVLHAGLGQLKGPKILQTQNSHIHMLESGKGQWDLLQLSPGWWWPSHIPWTSHSILHLETLPLKE